LTPENFPSPSGVIWHLLLPLSDGWGAGTSSRFEQALLRDRVDTINSQGGAITFDVPIAAAGTIPEPIMAVLQQLGATSKPCPDK
jgi:hypothetical protein